LCFGVEDQGMLNACDSVGGDAVNRATSTKPRNIVVP
jgi:hypothetical protein